MGHGHGHGHAGTQHRGRLAVVLGITLVVLAAEVVGAVLSGSLALLADAGHMVTDAAGLVVALIAATLAGRPAHDRRTWGYRRAEILAAAAQAALLLGVAVYVLTEAVRRLITPTEVAGGEMLAFGVIGLAGNAIGIALLAGARRDNLNLRAAFLEVVNDALGSVAVIVAALAVWLTGWVRADAIASILIGVLILPRTWMLLRESVDVLMESTPKGVDLARVREHLLAVPHVRGVHDLHASTVATGLPTLSAHVVVDDDCFYDGHLAGMLDDLQACVAGHFDVEHSTFQFERATHGEHEHSTHA